jgi:uncharacterized membrane protein
MDRAMDQAHALAAISAAFLGSLVDFAEALSIILAIGIIRGWMAAWVGARAGLTALAIIVAGLCSAMAAAPIHPLPFGMRWLRRAMLRAGAVIRMHAEDAIHARQAARLSSAGLVRRAGVDPLGAITAFKAVLLEGIEAAFIVAAIGAAGGCRCPPAWARQGPSRRWRRSGRSPLPTSPARQRCR